MNLRVESKRRHVAYVDSDSGESYPLLVDIQEELQRILPHRNQRTFWIRIKTID